MAIDRDDRVGSSASEFVADVSCSCKDFKDREFVEIIIVIEYVEEGFFGEVGSGSYGEFGGSDKLFTFIFSGYNSHI